MHQHFLAFLLLLASAADAAHLGARASSVCPTVSSCAALNSCYNRFTQAVQASAYCSALMGTTTKSTTVTQAAAASTMIVTKIVTVRGTTTVPYTSTIDAKESYVTVYQSCTSSATLASPTATAKKRQATSVLSAPGCLQYMIAPGTAAITAACTCIASRATAIVTSTRTTTPKASKYTWTGTVSLKSTIRSVTTVTNSPTYTVVMDPLPCALANPTTSTTVAPSSTPTICINQGLSWELFSNAPLEYGYVEDWTTTFDTYLQTAKSTTPNLSGITTTLGSFSRTEDPQITIYNNTTPFDSSFFTIEHHGYLHAPQTGQYTFTFGAVDDFIAGWFGPNAISGWTISNADNYLILRGGGTASVTRTLTADQYLPFRYVYANSYGIGAFQLSITKPDGTVITATELGNPYIVRYRCDGTVPPFDGWSSYGSA